MDPTIRQVIDGYAVGFEAHKGRLGADHPRYLEAAAVYGALRRAGEAAADLGSFFEGAGKLLEDVGAALAALGEVPTPEGAAAPSLDGLADEVAAAFDAARHRHLAAARDASAACRGLSQPCMEHHYAVLEQTLERVRTETELAFEADLLVECNSVENEWDTLLVHYLMKAVHETVGLLMDPSPAQQQTVENSVRFVGDFFGMDWPAVWNDPRAWDFWRMEYGKTRDAWVSERDCHTPEQARDYLTRMLEAVMRERAPLIIGPPEGQTLVLWDRPVRLAALLETYRDPPRPAVGFSEG
jgi:hypothetical protein